ncbi:MAG: hypothetical protein H6707_14710 [Deltaproteobacteria bacterium]|nr:hypothetical protein [Deltaproteobacteria bacterium]
MLRLWFAGLVVGACPLIACQIEDLPRRVDARLPDARLPDGFGADSRPASDRGVDGPLADGLPVDGVFDSAGDGASDAAADGGGCPTVSSSYAIVGEATNNSLCTMLLPQQSSILCKVAQSGCAVTLTIGALPAQQATLDSSGVASGSFYNAGLGATVAYTATFRGLGLKKSLALVLRASVVACSYSGHN